MCNSSIFGSGQDITCACQARGVRCPYSEITVPIVPIQACRRLAELQTHTTRKELQRCCWS